MERIRTAAAILEAGEAQEEGKTTVIMGAAGAFALVQTILYHRQMSIYREEAQMRE